jgi:hypothetical protein
MSTKTLRKRIALVAVSALGAGLLSVVAAPSANADAGDIATVAGVGVLASANVTTSTGTATMLSTGRLDIASTAHAGTFVVSSGAYISAVANASVGVVAGNQQSIAIGAAGTTFSVTPRGAVGSTFTVIGYTDATLASAVDILTVTIAGASIAGVASPADSTLAWTSTGTPATTDGSGKSTATVNTPLFLSIQLNDGYGQDITSTTGALVITTSAGAFVAVGPYNGGSPTQPAASSATFTTAVSGERPSTLLATIKEATVGAGWSGTVTVTYNGVTIGTKSGTITGAPASISVTPKKVGLNNGSATTDAFEYTVKDRAGNQLDFTSSNLVLSLSSKTSVVSGAVGNSTNATTTTAGKGNITCVSGATGSADVTMQLTLSTGTVVKSAPVKFNCGGNPVTYKASFDKASYVQGDIAKLTITFYDADGALATSSTTVSDGSGQFVSAPMLTAVGIDAAQIPASTFVDKDGKFVITYSVGTSTGVTEGSYNAIVDFTAQLTLSTPQTVGYKVTTGSTGVSNADVLKAIVSLIASINKQIAALQKALLRR